MKDRKDLFSEEDFEDGSKNLAYFMAAPIILDAYNFKEALKGTKWNEEDHEAYAWLQTKYNLGEEFFKDLSEVKFD